MVIYDFMIHQIILLNLSLRDTFVISGGGDHRLWRQPPSWQHHQNTSGLEAELGYRLVSDWELVVSIKEGEVVVG